MKRTNQEWLAALQESGDTQFGALAELREFLLRAVFVYLRDGRAEVAHLSTDALYEMAEDYAQEALLKIQDNLDKFRGDAKFTTWAYRFVINEAAADLRRRCYQEFSWDELAVQETAVFSILLKSKPSLDPEQKTAREELIAFLLHVLETELNERQRAAVLGVHFQGRSLQEVAESLETTPNTLYKMLHDARKKIKAQLLANHYSAGDIWGLFDNL
jgi:RNA polymerase sigma-70 factor (ECF subfamily)